MDNLPESLLIEILSRLTDSTESTRSRLISKTFNSIYPDLKSINLQCSLTRYIKSKSNSSKTITPFKSIFLNLILNLRIVESVCIGIDKPLRDVLFDDVEDEGNDLFLSDGEFLLEWLPIVSGSLKLFSVSDFWFQSCWRRSNLLSIVSEYCKFVVFLWNWEFLVKFDTFPYFLSVFNFLDTFVSNYLKDRYIRIRYNINYLNVIHSIAIFES